MENNMSASNPATAPNTENQPKDQANKDNLNPKNENAAKTPEQGAKPADQSTTA